MKMPSVRLDIVMYYIIIACSILGLWFCKTQIDILNREVVSLKHELKNSLRVPANEGFEVTE